KQLEALAKQLPAIARLRSVPGIGLLTATALSAFVGDISRFPSGRHLASYLGLTPREYSYRLGRSASGRLESASWIISPASGRTCFLPSGIKKPSSLSRPRRALILRVRSPSQPERSRCSAPSSCCGTVLIGTARICSFRQASSNASTSVRSVLFLTTYGLT